MNSVGISQKRAIIELVGAGVLWGFGFIATKWALLGYSVYELLAYRFLLAFLAGEILSLFFSFFRFQKRQKGNNSFSTSSTFSFIQKFFRQWKQQARTEIFLSLPAGLLMAAFLIPQTLGLLTTSAGKSGFLTTLYVVLVPVFSHLFFGEKYPLKVYGMVLLALFGASLLMNLWGDSPSLVSGDLWTLLCAAAAAVHILYVGKFSSKSRDSFRFNNFQSAWCLLCLIPFLTTQSSIRILPSELEEETLRRAVLGVLFMAFGSSLIAFTAQVRAQKVLSNFTASMLFLLESPFALLFGFLFLSEKLTWIQGIGAALVLFSSAVTVYWENGNSSSNKKKLQ